MSLLQTFCAFFEFTSVVKSNRDSIITGISLFSKFMAAFCPTPTYKSNQLHLRVFGQVILLK